MEKITLNNKKVTEVIAKYKENFDVVWTRESYKWELLEDFKKNWDIEAESFGTMFAEATKKAANLLSSMNNYPRGMMLDFIKVDAERVRAMFRNLYDESQELFPRILAFIDESEAFRKEHDPGSWKNHYQSFNAITTYLWLRFPDKYYIYKYGECRAAFTYLESTFIPIKKLRKETVPSSFQVFDQIRQALKADPECRALLDSKLNDGMYRDPELCTMTMDLNFFVSRYICPQKKEDSGKRYWIFSPGENAEGWNDFHENGIMGLGWEELGDFSQYNSLEEVKVKLREIDGPGEYMNDGLAVWQFVNDLKVGDVIYAKKGRTTVIGRGTVTGDYTYDSARAKFKSIRKVDWDFCGNAVHPGTSVMKTLTDITKYDGYHEKIDAAIDGKDSEIEEKAEMGDATANYYWMNANPKYWNVDEFEVGDNQEYTVFNENGNRRQMANCFTAAKPGDMVVVYSSYPVRLIKAIGRITEGIHHSEIEEQDVISFSLISKVDNPVSLEDIKKVDALAGMPVLKHPQGSLFSLTPEQYNVIIEMINGWRAETLVPYDYESDEDKPFLPVEEFESIVRLLARKKNIILQGSPGIGKTFIAKKIAYASMGIIDESRIKLIQFNQNYSYEDFIQGYKPSKDGFTLKPGVFFNFCQRAKDDPKKDYFFIIDEINRGNLSKIFGELLMLVEKPYRGEKHAMELAYSEDGETFFVPDNVYIIGMMNSADRSLAMIDYALRRRFSFVDMYPCFKTEAFKAYEESLESDTFSEVIATMKRLNAAISEDDSLGKGFEIGHSYFCGADYESCTDEWVADIVKYDIIPLLEEYWFDNKTSLEKWSKELKAAAKL